MGVQGYFSAKRLNSALVDIADDMLFNNSYISRIQISKDNIGFSRAVEHRNFFTSRISTRIYINGYQINNVSGDTIIDDMCAAKMITEMFHEAYHAYQNDRDWCAVDMTNNDKMAALCGDIAEFMPNHYLASYATDVREAEADLYALYAASEYCEKHFKGFDYDDVMLNYYKNGKETNPRVNRNMKHEDGSIGLRDLNDVAECFRNIKENGHYMIKYGFRSYYPKKQADISFVAKLAHNVGKGSDGQYPNIDSLGIPGDVWVSAQVEHIRETVSEKKWRYCKSIANRYDLDIMKTDINSLNPVAKKALGKANEVELMQADIVAKMVEDKDFDIDYKGRMLHYRAATSDSCAFLVLESDKTRKAGQMLIMESNNCEDENVYNFNAQALNTVDKYCDLMLDLNAPTFIPILPTGKDMPYYQHLSVEALETPMPNGVNVDTAVTNALEKAQEMCGNKNKIMLSGYSSTGVFAQRYALLHSEKMDTLFIGGSSDVIPIMDNNVPYPLGTGNIDNFDEKAYKNIKQVYYVGGYEGVVMTERNGKTVPMYDTTTLDRSVLPETAEKYFAELSKMDSSFDRNCDIVSRGEFVTRCNQNMGINISHSVYPETAHNFYACDWLRDNGIANSVSPVTNIREVVDLAKQTYSDSDKLKTRNLTARWHDMPNIVSEAVSEKTMSYGKE